MATDKKFAEFIMDQARAAGHVLAKPMFGDYGLYCDGKIVGLICDDQLFIKPTEAGKKFIDDIVEAPPYLGAKNYFLIEDKFEERDWISELIKITAEALPQKVFKGKHAVKKIVKKKSLKKASVKQKSKPS